MIGQPKASRATAPTAEPETEGDFDFRYNILKSL
jgi:hypothetical protein